LAILICYCSSHKAILVVADGMFEPHRRQLFRLARHSQESPAPSERHFTTPMMDPSGIVIAGRICNFPDFVAAATSNYANKRNLWHSVPPWLSITGRATSQVFKFPLVSTTARNEAPAGPAFGFRLSSGDYRLICHLAAIPGVWRTIHTRPEAYHQQYYRFAKAWLIARHSSGVCF